MALKVLMLRKRIDDAKKRLEALRSKSGDYDKRAKELEAAINEAATPEEQKTVEELVATYDTERAAYDQEVTDLEATIASDETELAELEKEQDPPTQSPAPTGNGGQPSGVEPPPVTTNTTIQRGDMHTMNYRNKILANIRSRQGLMQREDVAAFVSTARDHIVNKRDITGVGLLLPTVILGILRDNVAEYSKLYKHVNAQYITGTGRVGVMGTVPEAVWTEMCAKINELSLSFGVVDADGYKVAGYFALCNATAEDTDEELLASIIDALGKSIGIALDKAILYGTGTKMPMGIVTRLVQTTKPSTYPANAPAWKDLHTSNVKSISAANSTGTKLFQEILKATGNAKGEKSNGNKFWVMNEATLNALKAEALSINAAGAIVSGMENTMPVIGGAVETLSFVPDNVIIGGYGDLYLLIERQEARITSSEHVRFLEDQIVWKGTARYDGKPVVPEGFVAIGINATTPNATMTFAADAANTPPSQPENSDNT